MSSSDPKSKIDLLDDAETIRKKIAKAYCAPKETEGNGVLAIIQRVLLPFSALQSADGTPSLRFVKGEEAEVIEFTSYDELASAYKSGAVSPQAIKKVVEDCLVMITKSIQADYEADQEWQVLSREAYPVQVNAGEKEIKIKKRQEQERKKEAAREFQKTHGLVVGRENEQ